MDTAVAVSDSPDHVIDRITAAATAACREVAVDGTWISVRKTGLDIPAQGWKLHVSARPGTLAETLDRVLPLLLSRDCDFKVAKSVSTLRELNSGDLDPGAVGKALTVYPPQNSVVRLGNELAEALAGMSAPRIASDRRVRRDAPVYYRYAPFRPQFRVDDNGDFELVVIGPDGQTEAGAAGPEYSCPHWATDPFRPEPAPEAGRTAEPAHTTLGGRYRLTSGVMRGPRGNVYRAVDPDGRQVVVKEARAYVSENVNGMDLRGQMRNERRILHALDGVEGVPGLIDHFRHGEDEYLVTTDAGTRDLNRFVGEHGLFFDEPGDTGRDLGLLAERLLAVLDAVHERGVVVRDLSPKNIVLDDDGRCTLIDFGNSRYDGLQIPGWTRGYSVPDQHTERPAEPEDDYFSLGATLFFAASGMNPVAIDPDPVRNLERTLMCLARLYPDARTGVRALLPGLLSLDPAERSAAVADIRAGRYRGGAVAVRGSRPAPPKFSPDLLESALRHTLRECSGFATKLMADSPDPDRADPPVTNVYSGSAGLGMELLHHAESEAVAADLARWTVRMTPPARLPSALYFGRTGTALYLATARRMLAPDLAPPERIELGDRERGDYIHGVAGIGAGHLVLHDLAPGEGHLDIASECARRLLSGDVTDAEDAAPPAQPGSGVALEAGFAHGTAGIAYFLLAHHLRTGDPAAGEEAGKRFGALAAEAEELVAVMRRPAARPMAASWCQGMSGIASALVFAGRALDDDRLLALAKEGARACMVLAPQAWVVSQCCGLAGIGEALVDVATATGDEEFWRGAEEVAELMLCRSGGTPEQPSFAGNSLDTASGHWATGSSGVLSFLRRLHRRGGARLWSVDWTPPR
ncbi:serine/threonine protein kinase [Saccharopolyspora erythraea NRRL 2338]|uniref:non-specific serine/threonine protein kinase n=2 Tax=Saccharopolyspora erythraea TaxID=1836 RepID=A4FIK7_SACEN|nr:hypothetical protein N599_01950 [Saccharopolyspora erythraea D]PFG97558.1 serine/threonine protein kinase [Saccharopolyspora erythraea NRRL 2338]QRK87728.1 class IV lanthionine synthetase LanL [Saccharopolyspora erythraea]CAM03882.1 hypothetical protein SACE_4613 [Saccharopolyspora erythraea NRRL 2338]